MVVSIVAAAFSGSFGEEASAIGALAWGKVTLIDLYAGLAIFGAWVALRESNLLVTLGWMVALVTLGNLAAGVYLVLALRKVGTIDELLLGRRVG